MRAHGFSRPAGPIRSRTANREPWILPGVATAIMDAARVVALAAAILATFAGFHASSARAQTIGVYADSEGTSRRVRRRAGRHGVPNGI